MAVSPIITYGFGSYGSIYSLATYGFGSTAVYYVSPLFDVEFSLSICRSYNINLSK